MSHVFIIGATGGIGHRLCPMLVQGGHKVTGLHRKAEQAAYLSDMGVTPVLGDIIDMSADDLARAAEGADIFVFTAGAAGSGHDRTTAIDGDGPGKAITAARKVGAKRFYHVSAFPEAGRARPHSEDFEHYMVQKKRADVAVVHSGLDWVLIRPGTLDHADGNGKVAMGLALPYGRVARGSVAKIISTLINTPVLHHRIYELTDGDTPITDAVKAMVALP